MDNYVKAIRKKSFEKYSPNKKDWTPVDKSLFSPDKLFNVDYEDARKLRFDAIKYMFSYHYKNSYFYNKFCKDLEVKPEDIKNEDDFVKIPLISDLIFKDHPDEGDYFVEWLNKIYTGSFPKQNFKNNQSYDEIIQTAYKNNITLTFSSGTSGKFSFVPRDDPTWNRQMYMCSKIFEMSPFELDVSKPTVLWIGPNPNNTFLYIGRLNKMLVDLFDPENIYFGIQRDLTVKVIKLLMQTDKGFSNKLKSGVIRQIAAREQEKMLLSIINILDEKEKQNLPIVFGGTPYFIEMLMHKIEQMGLSYNFDNGLVVTAGGWKAFIGNKLPTDVFCSRVKKIFGIAQENCRDIYGMVECNALFVSCEGNYKHIPHSFLYPLVLDGESNHLGYNRYGRFAFIDPLANSYPGFIMTGDKVKLLERCPVCNHPGPVIDGDISRLSGIHDRGCGATLAKMFSEEIDKASKE